MKSKLAFIAIFFILGFAGFCQEAVDLGLSVKWATCNVGANTPEEYGEYYTFDEAKKISNSNWRVPTREEMNELLENCDYKWTTQNGVNGGLFTSKKNGNSIFLPAAGRRHGSDVYFVGYCGYNWSSSSYHFEYGDHLIYYYSDNANVTVDARDYGFSVRLVQDVK